MKKSKKNKKIKSDQSNKLEISVDSNCPYELSCVLEPKIVNQGEEIFCMKYCQFTEKNYLAISKNEKVEIYETKEDDNRIRLKNIYDFKDEWFYSFDWTFYGNELFLFAGGKLGRICNVFHEKYLEQDSENGAINELKFNPTDRNVLAVATAGEFIFIILFIIA